MSETSAGKERLVDSWYYSLVWWDGWEGCGQNKENSFIFYVCHQAQIYHGISAFMEVEYMAFINPSPRNDSY